MGVFTAAASAEACLAICIGQGLDTFLCVSLCLGFDMHDMCLTRSY